MPAVSVIQGGSTETDVTWISPVTIIAHEALFPLPSFADAVMVAEPLAIAQTLPPLTEATLGLLLLHVTLLLVAFEGQTVADNT